VTPSTAEAGVSVAVFDKMDLVGGNSLGAIGGFSAAGIKDSVELFFLDTMKGGYNKNDPALIQTFAKRGAATVAWFEPLGVAISSVSSELLAMRFRCPAS